MPRRRRAVITGGARGIGFGIATAMLDAGYEVTVTGFSEEEVAAVPERTYLSVSRLDVTQAKSVTELVERFDELDVLVNCAGIIFRDGTEYDIDIFQRVIDVNLTGTMRMCVASRAQSWRPHVERSSTLPRCFHFLVVRWYRPTPRRKAASCNSRSRWPLRGRRKASGSTPLLLVGL